MNTDITAIVPIYNGERYLEECLESLIRQSYKIEIILVDDGSTDKTSIICDDYNLRYGNIKVIHTNNGGVSIARNIGLKHVNTKYVAFIDADDVLSVKHFELLIETCNNELDVLPVCSYSRQIEDLENGKNGIIVQKEWKANYIFEHMLNDEGFDGYLWNKLFFLEIIKKNDILFLPEARIWEDMLFVEEYLLHIKLVRIIKNITYFYRINKSGATETLTSEKKRSKIDVCLRLIALGGDTYSLFFEASRRLLCKCIMEYLLDKNTKDGKKFFGQLKKYMNERKNVSIKEKIKLYLIGFRYN